MILKKFIKQKRTAILFSALVLMVFSLIIGDVIHQKQLGQVEALEPATVTGTVTNAQTGEPVVGAKVVVKRSTSTRTKGGKPVGKTTTDESGFYVIQFEVSGSTWHSLNVTNKGYLPSVTRLYGFPGETETVNVLLTPK